MRITRLPQWILVATAVVLAGCAKEQSPTTTSDAASPPDSPLPSLSAEPSAPPPPATAPALASPPPPGIAAVATGAGGATREVTLEDEEGNPIKGSLQIMQRAVELYDQMRFESVSEETDEPWPPLKDLSQLVKYKILARLPPAPPGKKWVLDPSGKKVTEAPQ